MTDDSLIDALDSRARRREERREFFRAMTGAAAVASGALAAGTAQAQTAPTESDVLNFALNLEYLEAQFYSYAVFGTGLAANMQTGTGGTQGAASGGRKVNFTDPVVAQYAKEIAQDEANHVLYLRAALGTAAVAQPAIDIGTSPSGAFSSAARAAGLIGAGQSFDPYANDENFLLGAFIFEDVGVTAYKGAASLLTNKSLIEATAGILAVEAYHAALIRTTLYQKGIATPSLRDNSVAISNARDSLDGASNLDEGIIGTADRSNIAPLDSNGIAFGRTPGQVLNIVYLNSAAIGQGGFFPAGVNGTIKTSTAN